MATAHNVQTSVSVGVAFLKEENYIVAYCPALDLSSYGETEEEAKRAFEEALELFLEETARKGSLDRVLRKLGWVPVLQSYQPPADEDKLLDLYKKKSALAIRKESVHLPQMSMAS